MNAPEDGTLISRPVSVRSNAVRGMAADMLSAKMLEAIRDYAIFALDSSGCVMNWSDAAAQITGYSSAEMIGQPFSTLGPQQALELESIMSTARATGQAQQERWWRRRDGGLILVDEVISPLDADGFVVIAKDLTERSSSAERHAASEIREAEGLSRERALRAELQAAERRASFLAEASSILVATSLDFDSTIKALARLAVSRLADWCVIHSIIDNHALEISHVAHHDPEAERELSAMVDGVGQAEWEQAVRSVISTGQSQILEFAGLLSAEDGRGLADEFRGEAVMITPLMGRGRVLGAITFVGGSPQRSYDEDDLMLAEELGRRAAIALDNARLYHQAQDASRAKGDFLAVISHELRTPLNAIMGYSDLLDARISGDLTDKQRRQIDRIRASARHLLQLIEEILSFARIESGGDEVRPELVDAATLIDEVVAVTEPLAAGKGLEFRTDAKPGVALETDAGKARQVLVNLMSNAIKFTDRGSVTLSMRPDGEHVVFEVADTGVGIAADQIDRIFDPFWQAERPNTRRVGGTGLGLSVSRRYVRLLRGDLEIRSEPGHGTCVTITLPLRLTGSKARPRD
jgi:PAS domain S-box-containing protein